MRLRAIVGSTLGASLVGCLTFIACRSVQPPPVETTPATSQQVVTPPPLGSSSPPLPSSAPAPSPEQRLAEQVRKARQCTDPVAAILNHPDGGVVFNNAMTSVDAGFIDRTQGVLDAIAGQAAAFRCCFDTYLREHPADEAKMMLRVTLGADGNVEGAEIDAARSTLADTLTIACVVAVAKEASYPVSPTGKQTVVEYPFRVGSGRDTK